MFDVTLRNSKGELLDTVHCKSNECGIGRARDNLIQIRGWRISPHHALLQRGPEGVFVEDQSDRGSTIVNGEPVDRYGPLRTSDEVNIGGFVLTVGVSQASDDDDEGDEDSFMQTVIGFSREALNTLEPEAEEKYGQTFIQLAASEQHQWRHRVHEQLLEMMDLRRTDVSSMDEEQLRSHISKMIEEILKDLEERLPDDVDRARLAKDVLDEAVGLGPLEELLADETVTEIMVNKNDEIFIEQSGKLSKSDVTFSSDDAVLSAIERIVSPLGRRIDESSPMVDARLRDGSRVNAIIPPLALRGPCLTIRKFSKEKLVAEDLVRFDAVSMPMMQFLEMAVTNHKNIIISGGTGSGKTTLLNVLSNYIPSRERIVTVEDAAELHESR